MKYIKLFESFSAINIEENLESLLVELIKCVYKNKRHRINWSISLQQLLEEYHKVWEKEFLKN